MTERIDFEKIVALFRDPRGILLVSILYETGCRVSELVSIQLNDINFQKSTIFFEQNSRCVNIPKSLLMNIKKYIKNRSRKCIIDNSMNNSISEKNNQKKKIVESSGYLFQTKSNSHLSERRVEQIIKSKGDSAGISISPTIIRKLFIKNQIQSDKVNGKINVNLNTNLDDKNHNNQNHNNQNNYHNHHNSNNLIKDKIKILGLKSYKQKKSLNPFIFEFLRHIDFDNLRDKLIFNLLIETGCKISEILDLKFSNVSFKNNEIIFNSGGIQKEIVQRKIQVSQVCISLLKQFLKTASNSDYIFPAANTSDKQISQRRIQQIFSDYSKRFQIKITPQVIRNTHVYLLHQNGLSIDEVKNRLGLKKIDIFTHGIVD